MTSISFPSHLTSKNTTEAIGFCRALLNSSNALTLVADGLRFADPFGLALLGATLHKAQQNGRAVSISGLHTDAGQYLQRMDVFTGVRILDIRSARRRHDRRGSLVELKRLEHAHDVDATASQLACVMAGHMPDVDPNELPDEMTCVTTQDRYKDPLQYILCELLENALTHARRVGHTGASVWTACQYFPARRQIQLAVVDDGCGFLGSLRRHEQLKEESDLPAIMLALQPRVSCNRELDVWGNSVNEGVGLTTATRIVEKAKGRTLITSGAGVYDSRTGIDSSLQAYAGKEWPYAWISQGNT